MDIIIAGVTYPMRASMRAWRKFEKNTGVKVAEVDTSDITLIPELIFYFVEEGCEHNGMRFTMDVDKWLSKIEVSDLPLLVEAMAEVMGGKQDKKKKSEERQEPLTWSRVEELGLGLLGLTPDSLYLLTFKEFGNAVKGKREVIEMAERSSWERVRWQTANLLNVHTKKGTSIKPKDLAVFPWEENEQSKKINTGFALLRSLANKK